MATPLRGIDGVFKVKNGSTYAEVAYTDSWSIPISIDTQEITKLNAQSKEFIRGLSGATLSAKGTLIWDNAQQQLMINQFAKIDDDGNVTSINTGNLEFTGVLKQGVASGTGDEKKTVEIRCAVIPTGFTIETSASGTPTWSYSGQITGDITFKITTETT